MTWEIFLGIVALVTFLIAIGGIVFKLAKVLTSLEATVKSLKEMLDDSKDDRQGMHKKLDNHETRLTRLEIKVDGSEN